MARFKVTGVEEVQRNLNKALKGINKNTSAGIAGASLFIKAQSQKLTSVKEGNLVRTAFSKEIPGSKETTYAVGYTADYAAAVHEMPDDTRWNRPGAENEFLEKAVVRNLTKIMNIIFKFAGRKP